MKLQKAERHVAQDFFDAAGLGVEKDTHRGHERRQRSYDVACDRYLDIPRAARIEVQADGVAAAPAATAASRTEVIPQIFASRA